MLWLRLVLSGCEPMPGVRVPYAEDVKLREQAVQLMEVSECG